MKIHESAENYLETILILHKKKGQVRSIDIVNELEFTKPSVSVAMKNLRQSGHILVDSDGHITLTEAGLALKERARNIPDQMDNCTNLDPEETAELSRILYKLLGKEQ